MIRSRLILIAIVVIAAALSVIVILWARRADRQSKVEAESKVLAALNPPRVEVANGRSAVVKIPDGYLLVVPQKTDATSGRYRVWFSETGSFKETENPIAQGEGQLTDKSISVKGRAIVFRGWGEGFTEVQLGVGDSSTGIALSERLWPTAEDVARLSFSRGTMLDPNAMRDLTGAR